MVHATQARRPHPLTSQAAETHESDLLLQGCPPTPPSSTPHTPVDIQPLALDLQIGADGVDRQTAVRELLKCSCHNLDPRQQLWWVLCEFKVIFALIEEEVGLTHLMQHKIDTGAAQPIKMCHLSLAHLATADNMIDEIQGIGIIEPFDSPWVLAVVMIDKKKFKDDVLQQETTKQSDQEPTAPH